MYDEYVTMTMDRFVQSTRLTLIEARHIRAIDLIDHSGDGHVCAPISIR